MSVKIHPTAVVHHSAQLDEDVSVGPYCVVGAGVRVGAGTVLHNHVTIQGPTTLGRENDVLLVARDERSKWRGREEHGP